MTPSALPASFDRGRCRFNLGQHALGMRQKWSHRRHQLRLGPPLALQINVSARCPAPTTTATPAVVFEHGDARTFPVPPRLAAASTSHTLPIWDMWQGANSRWYARDDKLIVSHPHGALVLAGWPRCLAWRCDKGKAWEQFRPTEPILRIVSGAASPDYVNRALRRFAELAGPEVEPGRSGSGLLGDSIGAAIEGLRALSTRSGRGPTESDFERQRIGVTRRHEAAVAFLGLFPPVTRVSVARLPERHWPVLSLLTRCPGADELYASNPALALGLACGNSLRARPVARPLRSARALLRKPRTAMLEWLGFPPAPWVARVLGKVVPGAVSVRLLRYLRTALRAESVPKAFLHLPRLDLGTLRILTDPELHPLAAFSLLVEIDRSRMASMRAAYLLRDAAHMYAARHGGRALPAQRSLAGLQRVHDELVERQNREGERAMLQLELPPAPVSGTESIIPLTTPAEILEEGRAMHHCVFRYVPEVARGVTYIYRVLEPERATVSLVRRGQTWSVGQLSGIANARVAGATAAAVHGWVEGVQERAQ